MSRARAAPPSTPQRRTMVLAGRRTSLKLEAAFWAALGRLAAARGVTLRDLVREIAARRTLAEGNLASALRVHALLHAPREEPDGGDDGPVRESAPEEPRAVVRGRQTASTIAAINAGRRRR